MSAQAVDFGKLDSAKPGDELRLCFKPNATDVTVNVITMHGRGIIDITHGDLLILKTAFRQRTWGLDQSPSFTVKVGHKWNHGFFVGCLQRSLESLDVVPAN